MTSDVVRELTERFKVPRHDLISIRLTVFLQDEELRTALGVLYRQGWINAGNVRYPMSLSLAFKKRIGDAWLSPDMWEDARKEAAALTEAQPMAGVRSITDCHEHGLPVGALLALQSAIVTEKAALLTEGVEIMRDTDVEEMLEENIQVKVSLPVSRSPDRGKHAHKNREGTRKTFSELLRESEMDEQTRGGPSDGEAMDACRPTGTDIARTLPVRELPPVLRAAAEIVEDSEEEGITRGRLEETLTRMGALEAGTEDVGCIMDSLCATGSFRRVHGGGGEHYFTKETSQRFFFELPQASDPSASCRCIPIRPWRDHRGNIHDDLLKKMQQHVLSTVLERPGEDRPRMRVLPVLWCCRHF